MGYHYNSEYCYKTLANLTHKYKVQHKNNQQAHCNISATATSNAS